MIFAQRIDGFRKDFSDFETLFFGGFSQEFFVMKSDASNEVHGEVAS